MRYIPTAGYFGPDSVIYTADDGFGGTATAIVSINVKGGGAIRGTVFNDLNSDGVRQADGLGLAGWGIVRVSSVVTSIAPLTVSGNGLLSVDFTFTAQLRTAAASTANFGLSTGSDGSFIFPGQLPFPFYFYAYPPLGEESLWQQTLPSSGGPAGGIFACEGGRVIVPALTLPAAIPFRCDPASVTVTVFVSPGHSFVRMQVDIGFEGRTEVTAPVTVCLPHTIADLAAAAGDRTNLRVGHLRAGYWEVLPYVFGNRDETCGTTVHFSPFGLLAVQPDAERESALQQSVPPDEDGDQFLLWCAFLFLSAFAVSLSRIRQIRQ